MKPYQFLAIAFFLGFTTLITNGLPADNLSDNPSVPPSVALANTPPSARPLGSKLSTLDPDTAGGFSHLYNLQYDKAIAAFDRTLKRYPTDPFALNHLLQAIVLKEMYRLNALDTTLYADNGFLAGKPLASDPQVKARILELADEGIRFANERLKLDPNDVDALYARGV